MTNEDKNAPLIEAQRRETERVILKYMTGSSVLIGLLSLVMGYLSSVAATAPLKSDIETAITNAGGATNEAKEAASIANYSSSTANSLIEKLKDLSLRQSSATKGWPIALLCPFTETVGTSTYPKLAYFSLRQLQSTPAPGRFVEYVSEFYSPENSAINTGYQRVVLRFDSHSQRLSQILPASGALRQKFATSSASDSSTFGCGAEAVNLDDFISSDLAVFGVNSGS